MLTSAILLRAVPARGLLCLCAVFFWSASIRRAVAQTPGKPAASGAAKPAIIQQSIATRPKNFYLMIFGYEMDKARADSILQTQDMTKDAATVVEKLEGLVRSKAAIHVSNAATPLRGGVRCALNTSAFSIEAEGTLPPGSQEFALKLNRTAKAGGMNSAVSASLDIQGRPFFIGSVPDTSPGKDQLLFMRCVVQYLE